MKKEKENGVALPYCRKHSIITIIRLVEFVYQNLKIFVNVTPKFGGTEYKKFCVTIQGSAAAMPAKPKISKPSRIRRYGCLNLHMRICI